MALAEHREKIQRRRDLWAKEAENARSQHRRELCLHTVAELDAELAEIDAALKTAEPGDGQA